MAIRAKYYITHCLTLICKNKLVFKRMPLNKQIILRRVK